MNYYLVFPMFSMVLLTASVLGALFRARVKAVRQGEVDKTYFRLYQGQEPESSVQLARHFVNIFEAPNLFYVACLAGMLMNISAVAFQVLAWSYVLARLAHAYVHIGRNRVKYRILAYASSWTILLAMWFYLAFHAAMSIQAA